MPELPEVETIVRALRPGITGKTISHVEIFWPRSIVGDCGAFINHVTGREISEVFRRGKYICLLLDDGGHLTIHLRMTGKLIYCPGEKDKKHLRVRFLFNGNTVGVGSKSPGECSLHFIDTRKFGKCQLWPAGEALLPALGPDPLDPGVVLDVLKKITSTRAIKTVLLDQHLLAGIGNIYADEALFAARLHPLTPAREISSIKRGRLSRVLPVILAAAIENKGTTLSDYRLPSSSSGSNQHFLKIYGRDKQPCPNCQTLIRRIVVNGRSSHFCPRCQKNNVPRS